MSAFTPRRVAPGAGLRWCRDAWGMLCNHPLHFGALVGALLLADGAAVWLMRELGLTQLAMSALMMPLGLVVILSTLVLAYCLDGRRGSPPAQLAGILAGFSLLTASNAVIAAWLGPMSPLESGDCAEEWLLSVVWLNGLLGTLTLPLCTFASLPIRTAYHLDTQALRLNPIPVYGVGLVLPLACLGLTMAASFILIAVVGLVFCTLLSFMSYLDIFEHRGPNIRQTAASHRLVSVLNHG